ncbi:MAG: hypothetical protein QM599_01815 [Pseudoxanthomonas sp.]
MTAVPLEEAAQALAVSTTTLRRMVEAGCPTARRGRRGRGCRTLFDLDACRAWQAAQHASHAAAEQAARDAVHAFAAGLPEILAAAAAEAHRLAPDKRGAAWPLVTGWQLGIGAIHDRLQAAGIAAADPPIPEEIERLLQIATR